MVKLGMKEASGVMAVHTLAHQPGVAGREAPPQPLAGLRFRDRRSQSRELGCLLAEPRGM